MPNQNVSLACTALLGTNKQGILKPNADGYYTLVLGALNVYNSGGAYYPLATAKEIFKDASSFMRRIASGALRGEYGHPRKTPEMSNRDFMCRVLDIYEPNVSHHIRKVWVDYTSVKDSSGKPVIAIIGEIKPSGPMGPALKASLENPSENVCFSVRSITNDENVMGVIHKNFKTIVTWDYVNEPGLAVAKKWMSPTLEAFDEMSISPNLLKGIGNRHQSNSNVSSMESTPSVTVESILEDLGWSDKQKTSPSWSKW